jgi:hypothetical protein
MGRWLDGDRAQGEHDHWDKDDDGGAQSTLRDAGNNSKDGLPPACWHTTTVL